MNLLTIPKISINNHKFTRKGTVKLNIIPYAQQQFWWKSILPEVSATRQIMDFHEQADQRRYSGIRVKLPSTRSGTSRSFCHFHEERLQMNGTPLTFGVP